MACSPGLGELRRYPAEVRSSIYDCYFAGGIVDRYLGPWKSDEGKLSLRWIKEYRRDLLLVSKTIRDEAAPSEARAELGIAATTWTLPPPRSLRLRTTSLFMEQFDLEWFNLSHVALHLQLEAFTNLRNLILLCDNRLWKPIEVDDLNKALTGASDAGIIKKLMVSSALARSLEEEERRVAQGEKRLVEQLKRVDLWFCASTDKVPKPTEWMVSFVSPPLRLDVKQLQHAKARWEMDGLRIVERRMVYRKGSIRIGEYGDLCFP